MSSGTDERKEGRLQRHVERWLPGSRWLKKIKKIRRKSEDRERGKNKGRKKIRKNKPEKILKKNPEKQNTVDSIFFHERV
jgi:hypothetical protein